MRPAGLMSAPPDSKKLRGLLERILEDHERVLANAGGDYLVLHSGSSSYRLPLAQVLYIEALDKKLNIWTRRQCISVYETLRDLETTGRTPGRDDLAALAAYAGWGGAGEAG